MDWKPVTSFANGLISGDFNASSVSDCAEPVCYDVNGNHSKPITTSDGCSQHGRGAWRRNVLQYPSQTSSVDTCSSLSVSRGLPLASTQSGSAPSWRSVSSESGNVWSGIAHASSRGAFSCSESLSAASSVATVHWPPAPGAAGVYNHQTQVPSGGLELQRACVPMSGVHLLSSPVTIPVPTRRLTAKDLNLLQNPLTSSDCAQESAADINPEHYIQRLPSGSLGAKSGKVSTDSTSTQKRPSYLEMVARALMSSSDLSLPLAKIYDYVIQNYPHLQSVAVKSWKNSVRHTLSSQPCFVRVQGKDLSLHIWALLAPYVADFRADQFHSGLIKKRAKQIQKAELCAHASPVTWQYGRSRETLITSACQM